jgi:hypothetical protein
MVRHFGFAFWGFSPCYSRRLLICFLRKQSDSRGSGTRRREQS